jgi:hypothetical protein
MYTKLELIKDLDYQIQDLTDDDSLENAIIDADDYEHSNQTRIKALYVKLGLTEDGLDQSHNKLNNSLLNTSQSTPRKVNLPKLQLPKFDGNILKWSPFYDAFCAAVHNDDNLDNIQKFQYLNSTLSGEAAHAIEGLPLTNSNYEEALSVLTKRYGQPHKIINSYMKALWELPKPSDNLANLKEFYDNLETYIRGLRSLGKTEDSYGDLLIPIIFDKLPPQLKTQISRDHGDKAWTLNELREAIEKEIQATEAGKTESTDNVPLSSTSAFFVKSKQTQEAKTNHPNKTYTPTCAFCKDSHYSNDCFKIKDKAKRYEIAKRDRLCFNCLRGNHSIQNCRSLYKCRSCSGKHHTALCMKEGKHSSTPGERSNKDEPPKQQDNVKTAPSTSDEDTHVKLTPMGTPTFGPVLLKTATARLWYKNQGLSVNILLDEGAQRSFVTEHTANLLQIKNEECTSELVNLATFGHNETKSKQLLSTLMQLETKSGEKLDISALIVPKISTPVRNYVQLSLQEHEYLKDLYWSIVGNHTVRGAGPTAVASKLGYLLSGPTHIKNSHIMNTMICKVLVDNRETERNLTDLWKLDSVGVCEEKTYEADYASYRDNQLKLEDGKYTASLPWKEDHEALPTNYTISNRRTRAMVRRLSPDIRKVYDNIINDQLSRGFVERVLDDDNTMGHYIPHHAVYKDSMTTPIRIVYDCSCREGDGPSLNDCLDTGPCLINDLLQILIRFRLHSIAFTSDIEKAFLNIRLHKDDRMYTKFLWLSDPDDPESEFNVYQFKAVLFGSVSSPFMLNAVIKSHLEQEPNSVTVDLLENIYVDNVVSGVETENDAVSYYNESIDVLKKAGFKLRSWTTNSDKLSAVIDKDNNKDTGEIVKVLGMLWEPKSDTLTFPELPPGKPTTAYTKRHIVKHTSTLFDPLGLASPVLIKAKIFIQKLWSLGFGWDETLPEDISNEWSEIAQDLDDARLLKISRPYSFDTDDSKDYQLHVFSDASMKAYGAVVYLQHGQEITLVMSKSRVKPLKDVTLPRLELLAAVVASDITKLVLQSLHTLPCAKVVLWCDSQIVLHWIHSNKKLPSFVANRLKKIKAGPFTDFKYCPTKDNPADLLTRGLSYTDLNNSTLWKNGPVWLPGGDWPICELFDSVVLNCLDTEVETDEQLPINTGLMEIIDCTKFSSVERLLRVTSYVLRFIYVLKNRGKKNSLTRFVTVPELNQAKDMWIKTVQSAEYPKELEHLYDKSKRKTPIIRQLRLFLDKCGTIRCRGRLENANLKEATLYPILLPRRHHFTKLLVQQYHTLLLHAGVGTTTAMIRHTFWIPQIRQLIKTIIHSCVICLKSHGKPYKAPESPPLPKFRLLEAPPFSVCGVDFTGVLYYKTPDSRNNKAYICLFTCAVTRAVHLEVVTDMTTDSFIRAFRRFAGRCSLPQRMVSDNGLTFVAGAESIQTLCKNEKVNNYLANRHVEWTFIPKRAPWFGGFYERLIGVTKSTLKKILGNTLVSLDELLTLVVEVEALVNERPLTYTFSELDELIPLTPSMLLYGRSLTLVPQHDVTQDELSDPDYSVDPNILDKRSKHLDLVIKQCWKRWKTEYLPQLREAHCANTKSRGLATQNMIKVGDVVLVHNDIEKRSHWPLAVVTKLNTGHDGFVRSAEIRTKNGTTNRPIVKLYPLEVSSQTEISENDQNPSNIDTSTSQAVEDEFPVDVPLPPKPKRQAALGAAKLIKGWTRELLAQ